MCAKTYSDLVSDGTPDLTPIPMSVFLSGGAYDSRCPTIHIPKADIRPGTIIKIAIVDNNIPTGESEIYQLQDGPIMRAIVKGADYFYLALHAKFLHTVKD